MAKFNAVCYGEVLWDVFPDGARIGGAPLNVASRLSSLGAESEIISSVGADRRGEEIISYLQSENVGTKNITINKDYPTGIVDVTLSEGGSASYEISHPAAWDQITWTEEREKAISGSDVFIFGSLACRDEVSRQTLLQLLPRAKFRVFDCNLRPPHYQQDVVTELMQQADFIKFNDDELFEIAEMLGSPFNSLEQNIGFLKERSGAEGICVTKGKHGAVLLHQGRLYYNSGYKIRVKDTVGAGDSFLATLLANLLKEQDIQASLDMACAMGALVAGREGANPAFTKEEIEDFMKLS